MGYRAEKEKSEKKLRLIKGILFAIAVVLVVVFCVYAAYVPPETWKYHFGKPKIESREEGELRVHFLDVGQADSTLIEFPDGKTMLIDGGDVDADEKILRYLNALKIKRLDYLLLTHSDSDHCGALDKVLAQKDVGTVILPLVSSKDEKEKAAFGDFSEALAVSDAKTELARRYLSVESSDERYPYVFSVLFPHYSGGGGNDSFTENELSTICWLDYFGTSVLFCGDTSADVLSSLIDEDAFGAFDEFGIDLKSTEILKVPHHGSKSGLTAEVLDYFNADTGIISCGKNNLYGHPDAETLDLLIAAETTVYRTDWQGDILLTAFPDGNRRIDTGK